jgi:hypothetical protein
MTINSSRNFRKDCWIIFKPGGYRGDYFNTYPYLKKWMNPMSSEISCMITSVIQLRRYEEWRINVRKNNGRNNHSMPRLICTVANKAAIESNCRVSPLISMNWFWLSSCPFDLWFPEVTGFRSQRPHRVTEIGGIPFHLRALEPILHLQFMWMAHIHKSLRITLYLQKQNLSFGSPESLDIPKNHW